VVIGTLAALAGALPADALAGGKAIVIGGGPRLGESQGQIERNVLWLQQLLPRLGYQVDMYFGIGNEPGDDIVYLDPDASDEGPRAALADVFEAPGASRLRYKRHAVTDVLGSTREEELTPALEKTLAGLAPEAELLLIFNGHGGEGRDVYADNTLDLWGPSAITVVELDRILEKAPDQATIRFVLPQCFSGGFASLMYRPPGNRRLSTQNRCGFMSQEAKRGAEGCQLDVGDAEYRDYTTYFFAALAGRSRQGGPLASDPDLDRDGKVSLREAHWYTLRTAVSYDLSRSTSEVFLEDWEPRALRDARVPDNAASVYWQIAADVAARHGWGLEAAELESRRRELDKQVEADERSKEQLSSEIEALQKRLRELLIERWPQLRQPLEELPWEQGDPVLGEINAFLAGNAEYIRLRAALRALPAAENAELERARLKTQVEKVERMLNLARLEALFDRHAERREREQYRRLVDCEEG
jgi:hypothetical protein